MQFSVIKHKKLIIFLLTPIIICSIIGFFLGIITNGRFPQYNVFETILFWVISLNPGVIAHEIAWLLGHNVFKWKMSPNVRGTWKQNSLGLLLTFVFVLIITYGEIENVASLFLQFFQVAAICIIIYVFLFQFKFYHTVEELFYKKEKLHDETLSIKEEPSDFLRLKNNERIEKINLNQISHIIVEDHYCTVVYYKDKEWQKCVLYEKLTNFEQKYPSYLLRINRSTLVNPKMVKKLKKIEGKYYISMKANPESPFPLSPSQKHHLDKLVPKIT